MKTISAALLLLFSSVAFSQPAAQQTAFESVQESTDILLKRLVEVKPIHESDPDLFFSEVDDALNPYIDFEGFAKRVMAKHWRKATPAQQSAFVERFRRGLIKTYSTALLEFDNQRVDVLEPSSPQDVDRAVVEISIHANSGAIYPVHYQLELHDGHWLVRNVLINGINMGLQFRTQFNASMQKYRGNVDEVIENWSVDAAS